MAVHRVNEVELRAVKAELELAKEKANKRAQADIEVKTAELQVVKDQLKLLQQKITAREDDTVHYVEDDKQATMASTC